MARALRAERSRLEAVCSLPAFEPDRPWHRRRRPEAWARMERQLVGYLEGGASGASGDHGSYHRVACRYSSEAPGHSRREWCESEGAGTWPRVALFLRNSPEYDGDAQHRRAGVQG